MAHLLNAKSHLSSLNISLTLILATTFENKHWDLLSREYGISTGTSMATAPADVTLSDGTTLACFEVAIPTDKVLEEDELLTVTLNTGEMGVTINSPTSNVTIRDTTGEEL